MPYNKRFTNRVTRSVLEIRILHFYARPSQARAVRKRSSFIFPNKDRVTRLVHRSISMRGGPAFLQFDWSKAGLSMDLPVFVHSHTKTSFKFLSRQGRYRAAFYVVGDFYFKLHRENLTGLFFCLQLSLPRSTDHRDRNLHHYLIVSSPHAAGSCS